MTRRTLRYNYLFLGPDLLGKIQKELLLSTKKGMLVVKKPKNTIELASENVKYDDDFDPIDEDKIAQIRSGDYS